MSRLTELERLENSLMALEDSLLDISDEDLKKLYPERSSVSEVQKLISSHLTSKRTRALKGDRSKRSRSAMSMEGAMKSIALLQRLIEIKPDLRPQLHAVLSSGKAPTDTEVEQLVTHLSKSMTTNKGKDKGKDS